MKSLYINTTGVLLQLCFKEGDKVCNFLSDGSKSQSEEIFEAISSVLGDVKISDLDFVVVVVGPGSFTGIRLGLSVVKGFLIATGVPVVCVNNFEAVYYTFKDKCLKEYNICFDAGGKDCYFAKLDKDGEPVGGYSLMLKSDVVCDTVDFKIEPVKVLEEVESSFDKALFVQKDIEPLYIKPHYAKKKDLGCNK
ncbi:tRNA (adenosine(37)-N6)-threonylcarbamoyltransferase complex dimerization subunit type 1 TsaB [bacterium]|nr:tRNA (adenosine(37)-N6)-threonylcarbamoyltransferase complex dimerization subunit type 1 TsaB [bacterium]